MTRLGTYVDGDGRSHTFDFDTGRLVDSSAASVIAVDRASSGGGGRGGGGHPWLGGGRPVNREPRFFSRQNDADGIPVNEFIEIMQSKAADPQTVRSEAIAAAKALLERMGFVVEKPSPLGKRPATMKDVILPSDKMLAAIKAIVPMQKIGNEADALTYMHHKRVELATALGMQILKNTKVEERLGPSPDVIVLSVEATLVVDDDVPF